MQIDPRIAFYFGVWTSILLLIGGGTVNLTHVFPDAWIPTINSWCVFLGAINSVILTAFNGYSSAKTGPLVHEIPGSPGEQREVNTLGKPIIGLLVLGAASAFAASFPIDTLALQSVGQQPRSTIVPAVARPAASSNPARRGNSESRLSTTQVQQNPFLLLQRFSAADLEAALADADAQTPPDAAGARCYTALLAIVKSGTHSPLPTGPGLFQALQKARDAKAMLVNMQSPNGPLSSLNDACASLVLDAQNTLLGLGLSVGLVGGPAGVPTILAGLPAIIAGFLHLPTL